MEKSRMARSLRGTLASRRYRFLPTLTPVCAAAILMVCTSWSARAQSGDEAAGDTNKVVATVGNHKITEAEVDEQIRPEIAGWRNRLYQLRRDAIQKIADDYIIDQAAKKAGMSTDKFMEKQLAGKSVKVTDKEAKEFYDSHKNRIPQPYDQIKAPLIAALQRRNDQEARQQVIARLREDNHIKMMIEPPRLNIATKGYPALGPKNAPITLVEFADFQCPYCKRSEETVKELRQEYGDKIRLVYIDFPLTFHQYAFQAAEAARCAGDQGKFWEYHDELFKDQSKLSTKDLKEAAVRMKLKTKQFDQCLDSGKYANEVRAAMKEGSDAGVDGTPGFFVNGRPVTGAQPASVFENVINEELARADKHQQKASVQKSHAG
jgi:protein-disulfide isomerase